MTTTTTTMITPKDSFDRFSDYLCQLLLQYLPIDDRLRLHSVSKQWQSLIFNTQTHLVFDGNLFKRMSLETKKLKFIETIVKKSSKITSVTISDVNSLDRLLDLLIKHCNQLRHISLKRNNTYDWLVVEPIFDQFIDRFGQQLQTFKFDGSDQQFRRQLLYKLCDQRLSHLKTVDITSAINLIDLFTDSHFKGYRLPNGLQSFAVQLVDQQSQELFTKFADTYNKQMLSLDISVETNIMLMTLITGFEQMKQLKQLTIVLKDNFEFDFISTLLATIGRNCLQLKAFNYSLNSRIETINQMVVAINEHMSPQLRRLSMDCYPKYDENLVLTSGLIDRFHGLTHLTLEFHDCRIIDDQFFRDIHCNLPKLQYLHIGETSITEMSIESIGQLANLTDLYLQNDANKLTTSESFISKHLLIGTKVKHLYIAHISLCPQSDNISSTPTIITTPTVPKTKPIDIRLKNLIINYCKKENEKQNGKKKTTEEISAKFGISIKSLYNIKKMGAVEAKRAPGKKAKYTFCDDDYEVIDNIICDLITNRNQFVTFTDVHNEVNNDENCQLTFKNCSYKTFCKLMHKMKYTKKYTIKLIREELIETPRIQNLCKKFLCDKLQIAKTIVIEGGTPVFIYIDECCVDRNHVMRKTLVPINNNIKLKTNKSAGKGGRFTVIHAGGEEGFVKNAECIIYKSEVNAEMFENWLENQLMPNLLVNSIVIFDNAPIHSRQTNKMPTQASKKDVIKQWLLENDIEFSDDLNKKELLAIVKQNKKPPQYIVDDIIRKFKCFPLRLPPYMCDLNPIEEIWNTWKQRVGKFNVRNSQEEFARHLSNSFTYITPTVWGNTVRNMISKVESPLYKKFNIFSIPNSDHNYL